MEQIEIVDSSWPAIQADQTIYQAIELLNNRGLDYLPVLAGEKLVGELVLSSMVRSTLMDIRDVEVKHIMQPPKLVLVQEGQWPSWAQKVVSLTPVIDDNQRYVGITSPDLINKGFAKMLKFHLERFRAVLDCTHNGIMAIDNQGKLTIFNRAAGKVLNLVPEEVIGQPADSLFPTTGLLDVVRTGQAQYSRQISHGSRVFISNRTPIIYEGEIVGAVAVFQDVSELTRVSQQLDVVKELNEELDAIIQYSHDGICITDHQGLILRLNPAFQRVTGLDGDKYLGKKLRDLLEQGIMDNSATLKVLEKGEPATVMQTFNTGKHTISTAYPIFGEAGAIARVVTNIRDVTELNLLREELEHTRLLTSKYQLELSKLRKENSATRAGIIGHSEAISHVLDLALRVAGVDTTVLLLGESGVGKEKIAHIIHQHSLRKDKGSFVELNCGAIPKELLESELFGYEGGAFTGAKKEGKLGYFELANHGTLFLDEIADLPMELQVKLLRVLQEQELVRLGGQKSIKIDVRIIAATNRDLEAMVAEGHFRKDLYYRLHVVPISIPPLRQRPEDIAPLLIHYLSQYNNRYNMKKQFSQATIEVLEKYDWPGNVRELVNLVERLVVISPGDSLTVEMLPRAIREKVDNRWEQPTQASDRIVAKLTSSQGAAFDWEKPLEKATLKEAQEMLESKMFQWALDQTSTYQEGADLLGISIATFNRKLERYGLQKRKHKSQL